MNCVNHPDAAVAAYCQNCGKALCTNCVRSVAGVIYCEQCLAAKLGIGAAPGAPAAGMPPNYPGVIAPAGPNPGLAFALGFIPGVGAMYNGQFIKGMIHVLIFVILVGISKNHDVFGIFVVAWIAYQVFDSYQTAKARRHGLPLPDPFGLNDLGSKLGIPSPPMHGFTGTSVPPIPPVPPVPPPPGAGFPPVAGFTDVPYTNVPPVPPPPGMVPPPPGFNPMMGPPPFRRREPIGAMILIGLGLLFLLNTLDIFHFDWIGRLWPLLIIALGAALFIRRTREIPPPPPPPTSGGPQ